MTPLEKLKLQIQDCWQMNLPLDCEKDNPLYPQESDSGTCTEEVAQNNQPIAPTISEVSPEMAPRNPKADVPKFSAPHFGEITQPDSNGEFKSPLDGALWMALTYGIPQTPLRGKIPFLSDWPAKASADPAVIRAWDTEYPGCNFGFCCTRARLGKHFTFEADKPEEEGTPTIRERFKRQGHDFTSGLIIESSPGKTHNYYKSAPGVDNIGQNAVLHKDFSVRVHREQCVSPGSIHPVTGKQYRVAFRNGPLTQPTAQGNLVLEQRTQDCAECDGYYGRARPDFDGQPQRRLGKYRR